MHVVVPEAQVAPQAPQLALLVSTTHAPEQLVWPEAQHTDEPVPPESVAHERPVPQAVPEAQQI